MSTRTSSTKSRTSKKTSRPLRNLRFGSNLIMRFWRRSPLIFTLRIRHGWTRMRNWSSRISSCRIGIRSCTMPQHFTRNFIRNFLIRWRIRWWRRRYRWRRCSFRILRGLEGCSISNSQKRNQKTKQTKSSKFSEKLTEKSRKRCPSSWSIWIRFRSQKRRRMSLWSCRWIMMIANNFWLTWRMIWGIFLRIRASNRLRSNSNNKNWNSCEPTRIRCCISTANESRYMKHLTTTNTSPKPKSSRKSPEKCSTNPSSPPTNKKKRNTNAFSPTSRNKKSKNRKNWWGKWTCVCPWDSTSNHSSTLDRTNRWWIGRIFSSSRIIRLCWIWIIWNLGISISSKASMWMKRDSSVKSMPVSSSKCDLDNHFKLSIFDLCVSKNFKLEN